LVHFGESRRATSEDITARSEEAILSNISIASATVCQKSFLSLAVAFQAGSAAKLRSFKRKKIPKKRKI